jgi:alginate O-acetyltransferase complex protein AlgI
MVFSSITFLFYFLPFLLIIYYFTGRSNLILLLGSLIFYAWGEIEFVFLLLLSCLINYAFGLLIESKNRSHAKLMLSLGIACNLILIVVFKYAHFILDTINLTFRPIGLCIGPISIDAIHLPLGISFFTFQAISYLVDIYRKDAVLEKNPITVALYISMFPQLIAGPIVRFHTISHALHFRKETWANFARGLQFLIAGLGQKVLIANTVAVPADKIFSLPPESLNAVYSWAGAICYMLQIYFDFAGYSNMAIGLGMMFGFQLPKNFDYPYTSQSITEFWRRWHMTLSGWFRDYLYIPLGGNRKGRARTYANLLIVFFLCGLWHGASWTFVCWGLYHGFFLIVERMGLNATLSRIWKPFSHAYALLVILIGWIIFRSDTIAQALIMSSKMFAFYDIRETVIHLSRFGSCDVIIAIAAGIIFSTPLFYRLYGKCLYILDCFIPSIRKQKDFATGTMEIAGFLLVLLLVLMSLSSMAYNPFIYFRF